ncbi:MAG: GNAT family N-acetyltransferase [Coprobacillus sp.]
MILKEVALTNNDLIGLVKELDLFFDKLWGASAIQYQGFHQLSKMAYAVVCYDKDLPVGCGCFKIIDEQTIEIKRMYVKEEYRCLGIASMIISQLENEAIYRNFKISTLQTGKDMQDSISFYKKMGYYLVDNYGVFLDDELCVCMKKDLL